MSWLTQNKGVLSILITLITLGGGILYKVASLENMAAENTEYRKESEESRRFFAVEFAKFGAKLDLIIDELKEAESERKELKDYNKEQENIIRKFYYLNKDLKDPRLHSNTFPIDTNRIIIAPITPHYIHGYDIIAN
jgi:hypothetical protein